MKNNNWIIVPKKIFKENEKVIIQTLKNAGIEFEYTYEGFKYYLKSSTNIIIKYKNNYLKIYGHNHSFEKEKLILEKIKREFYFFENCILTKEVAGENLSSIKNIDFQLIKNILVSIKNFWDLTNVDFDEKVINDFKDERKSYIKKIFKNHEEVNHLIKVWEVKNNDWVGYCHKDLNGGNIIINNEEINIIDFELSGVDNYYMDLASLIVENNFNKEQINLVCDFMKININDLLLNIKIFSIRSCIDWLIRFEKYNNSFDLIGHKEKIKQTNELLKLK